MNFKEFLILSEIFSDLATKDVSHINLLPTRYGGYRYNFSVPVQSEQGTQIQNFSVEIEKINKIAFAGSEVRIDGFYKVDFTGPSGFSLTGLAGSASSAIYSNMLLALKKLFEIQDVNAITFTAYDENMIINYNNFVNKYLKPNPPAGKGFIQVNTNTYVKKEWLKNRQDKMTSDDLWGMVGSARETRAKIAQVQNKRRLQRDLRRNLDKYKARKKTFVYMAGQPKRLAFLMEIEPIAPEFYVLIYNIETDEMTYDMTADVSKFDWDAPINKEEIAYMLDNLTVAPENRHEAITKASGIKSIPIKYWREAGVPKPSDDDIADLMSEF